MTKHDDSNTPRHVTQADVARAAGVSPATVSYVLSGTRLSKVSETTQARVLAAARQLGYRPNRLAQGLKTQRSYAIGVVCTDTDFPLFGPAMKAVETVAADNGYHVILHNAQFDQKREQAALQFLEELRVDGAIFLSSSVAGDSGHLVEFSQRVPLVVVNRFVPPKFPVRTVRLAHDAAGYEATHHLLAQGMTTFIFLGTAVDGVNCSLASIGRYEGFRQCLIQAGHPWEQVHQIIHPTDSFDTEDAYKATRDLLAGSDFKKQLPVGIYAINDFAAVGAMRAALDAGFRIPEDVAVVGNDNSILAPRFIPALSSLDMRLDRAGEEAAQLLLSTFSNSGPGPETTVILPELIVRRSSKRDRFAPDPTRQKLNDTTTNPG